MIPTIVRTKRFACPCPGAFGRDGSLFTYDHLAEGENAGPWYCDHCHVGWMVTVVSDAPVIRDDGDRMKKFPVRLRLKVAANHVGSIDLDIIVPARVFRKDGTVPTVADLDADGQRYFFEQHNCPENYLKEVSAIYLDGDDDPHALFDFVGVEPEDEE